MPGEKKIDELGYKTVLEKYYTTSKAAIQFAGKGIDLLRSIPEPRIDVNSDEAVIPISDSELIGKVCIGNLLFAQGIELIIKIILLTEKIPDKGFKGQHSLSDRFEAILKIDEVKSNINKWMPIKAPNKLDSAKSVVQMAENAFMISRYIGFKKDDLKSIDAMDAAGLLLALTISYKGLEQIHAARIIGIDIKRKDGKPIIQESTLVKMKKNKNGS